MNRRRLFQAMSLSFGLLLAASILTPQGGAQDGIQFEMPRDEVKKKAAKPAAASPATVEVLNGQSAGIESLVDGDAVKLKVTLEKAVDMAYVALFKFADDERQIDKCIITPGAQSCETKVAPALGWYWGKDGKGQPEREIRAESGDQGLAEVINFSGTVKLRVYPRPVVFVHGLASNAAGWAEYTKQGGYLEAMGLHGFAVGDGQAEGKMFMGDPAQPLGRTKTISQNAEEIGRYIAGVKRETGAQTVDLVAHGLGGLVSRYYIDRLMGDRDVAQLIMLGPPHGGTGSANLPASLGIYVPATLELRPAYLAEVFNGKNTRRHGVPFHLLACAPISEPLKAPCAAPPSDPVMSRPIDAAITAPTSEAPLLHADLTGSQRIFKDFVAPRLQRRSGEFHADHAPALTASSAAPEQFTKVFTGHVDAGGSREVVINLDRLSAANFLLYDTTRSLAVTIHGANGNVINLTPDVNGLVEGKDAAALFTLGYRLSKPSPGAWKVILRATERTPGRGADYAFAAKVAGGATLRARADRMVTTPGQPITISSALELAGRPVAGAAIQARIHRLDGGTEEINFTGGGDEKRAVWVPKESGVYAVDVLARGSAPDGLQVERADSLYFEVQPGPAGVPLILAMTIIAGITLMTAGIFWLMNRRKAKQSW